MAGVGMSQRPPTVARPIGVIGSGVGAAPRKKPRWTSWIIWASLALLIAGFAGVWWMMMGMVQDVTFELPREQAVVGSYPEVSLNATFKGIWGEADRGTWIFEYLDVQPSEAAAALLKNAKEAG